MLHVDCDLRVIKIELPWPDAKLSPNAKRRSHWRSYSPVSKQARLDAQLLTLDALQQAGVEVPDDHWAHLRKINMDVTFYPPDKRHRDADNMVGAVKAQMDGIADGLGVSDHRFRPTFRFADPEPPGRVVFEIEVG